MIAVIKNWWAKRQLDKAQATIESYGLSVVKITHVGGSAYFVRPDGEWLKLEARKVKGNKK